MSRRAIATFCAIPTALFLLVVGILHTIVNVSGLRPAIERGEIPARLGDSVLVNAAFSGAAMSVLGLLVLLVLPGLRAGSREAGRVATAIGIFVAVVGAASYLWVPTRPRVLIFLVFGALLAAPLVIWRREFANP
jgi:chromate transport protein ChrA